MATNINEKIEEAKAFIKKLNKEKKEQEEGLTNAQIKLKELIKIQQNIDKRINNNELIRKQLVENISILRGQKEILYENKHPSKIRKEGLEKLISLENNREKIINGILKLKEVTHVAHSLKNNVKAENIKTSLQQFMEHMQDVDNKINDANLIIQEKDIKMALNAEYQKLCKKINEDEKSMQVVTKEILRLVEKKNFTDESKMQNEISKWKSQLEKTNGYLCEMDKVMYKFTLELIKQKLLILKAEKATIIKRLPEIKEEVNDLKEQYEELLTKKNKVK